MNRKLMLLASLCFLIASMQTTAQQGDSQQVILVIDRVGSKFVYKMDGKVVPTAKLIDRLTEKLPKQAVKPTPGLVLLVHNKAGWNVVENARGLVTKVGFDWPRVFYFSDDKRHMAEISISKPVPFSENAIGTKVQ